MEEEQINKILTAMRVIVQEEVQPIKQEISGMKQEISEMRQEIDGIKEEISEIKQEIDGMKQEFKEIRKQMIELKQELLERIEIERKETAELIHEVGEMIMIKIIEIRKNFESKYDELSQLSKINKMEHEIYDRRIERLERV